jgi:protein-tyrosine-phosphatase
MADATPSVLFVVEVGVDINLERPKPVDLEIVRTVDVVVTLGREAYVDLSPVAGSRNGIQTSQVNAVSTGLSGCG